MTDELQLLREVGADTPEPDEKTALRVYGLAIEIATRPRVKHARSAGALAVAVVTATTIALAVTAPWHRGPRILERAAAAIQPAHSQVLHMEVSANRIAKTQYWIQGAAPRHFRVRTSDLRHRFPARESGGTLGPATRTGDQPVESYLTFNSTTKTLVVHERGYEHSQPLAFDPVAVIRSALASGTAHVDGTTKLDGKPAIRIRLTTSDIRGNAGTLIYIVDAANYQPIEARYLSLAAISFPLEPIFAPHGWALTLHFRAFTYLPATPKNIALSNIQAQHRNSRTVHCDGYQCTVTHTQRPA